MKALTAADLIGAYGPRWEAGVLTEHLNLAREAGMRRIPDANGVLFLSDRKGRTVPAVCSELVSIPTEDGPIVGRCGEIAVWNASVGNHVWCEGHDQPEAGIDCEHGLSKSLCAGPGHYPMDY